jgi:hypothetical protein
MGKSHKNKKIDNNSGNNKQLVKNIILSLPIGALYYIFVLKLNEVLIEQVEYDKKMNRTIAIGLVAGLSGFILALKVFGNKNLFTYNLSLLIGLILGSIGILTNSVLYNWDFLSQDTKLIIIGISLIAVGIFSYR